MMMNPETIGDYDDETGEYDTGPFCRHYSYAGDCVCPCGHACEEHKLDLEGGACTAEGCSCDRWRGEPGEYTKIICGDQS